MFRVVNMKEIELCMKYTCKRCPLNKKCEEEYRKTKEGKRERRERKERRKAKGLYDV